MIQKLQQVEKEMTVSELLSSQNLNPNMYWVDVDGRMIQGNDTIKQGESPKIVPKVSGG